MAKHVGALVAVGLLVAGCSSLAGSGSGASSNHAPPENTSAPVDALADPTHPGLETCGGSVSASALADSLEIASDFKESCHELIVCGGLATNFSSAVIDVLLNAALGNGSAQLTYKGNGVYETGNAGDGGTGVVMDITAILGADTTFGKAGDVINFNLLDIATYFTGAKLTASATIGTKGASYAIGASFTSTGPGFELLGLGSTGQSPMTIDSNKVEASLGKILIKTHIHQSDSQGHALFTYDVSAPPQSLTSALSGDSVPFTLEGLTGARADLGQTIKVTSWQIGYLDTGPSGYMNGTIAFQVTGGPLPYTATFHYPNRKAPDVSLSCN